MNEIDPFAPWEAVSNSIEIRSLRVPENETEPPALIVTYVAGLVIVVDAWFGAESESLTNLATEGPRVIQQKQHVTPGWRDVAVRWCRHVQHAAAHRVGHPQGAAVPCAASKSDRG